MGPFWSPGSWQWSIHRTYLTACICVLRGDLRDLPGAPSRRPSALLSCRGVTWVLWRPSPGQIPRPVLVLCHARLRGGVARPGLVVTGVVSVPSQIGRRCKWEQVVCASLVRTLDWSAPKPVPSQTSPQPSPGPGHRRCPPLLPSGDAGIGWCTWEGPAACPQRTAAQRRSPTVRASTRLHSPVKQNVLCVELNFSTPNSPLSAEANTYLPPMHPPKPVPLLFHLPADPWNVSLCLLLTSVQFSSLTQSCLQSMGCSTPGFPAHHQHPELAQTHVIKLVMPSNRLILCHPLLLLSVFPSIRVFSSESVLLIS